MSQEVIIRFAAIQMCAELADVNKNLAKTEVLIHQAAKQGASWAVLPEFFTSACAFHPRMLDAILPIDGQATQLLKRLSKELEIVIGGSFLAKHENDIFNTFILVFPDGKTYCHNKDIPTMWENCYYIGGNDDGVINTQSTNVGAALCWEMLRTATARRLIGKVDFVLSGSCWWNLPESAPDKFNPLRKKSLALLKSCPSTFAKLLSVPVIHAGHAGQFDAYAASSEKKQYKSHYLGETKIVDGNGAVLAELTHADGEGVITADISLQVQSKSRLAIPNDYWIPEMPKAFLGEWKKQNHFGKAYYEKYTCERFFN